jgi:hypothetical protein
LAAERVAYRIGGFFGGNLRCGESREVEMNRRSGRQSLNGAIALIIAVAAIGMLGWKLWPG